MDSGAGEPTSSKAPVATMASIEKYPKAPENERLTNSRAKKPPPSPVSAKSTGIVSTPSGTTAVSLERKEELLIEARSNRIKWISLMPLPFRIFGVGAFQKKKVLEAALGDKDVDANADVDESDILAIVLMDDQYDEIENILSEIDGANHPFLQNETLIRFLESNNVCSRMSSTTRILSYLYGMYDTQQVHTPGQVAERIQHILGPINMKDTNKGYDIHTNFENSIQKNRSDESFSLAGGILSNNQRGMAKILFEEEMRKLDVNSYEEDAKELLLSYQDFLKKAQTPECALLVQGIRNFVSNFNESNQHNKIWKQRSEKERSKMDSNESIEKLTSILKSYIDSTYESIKGHVAWNMNENIGGTTNAGSIETKINLSSDVNVFVDDKNLIRRSLTSFIYGHCYKTLTVSSSILWKSIQNPVIMDTKSWMEKLNTLQFISPDHLDIKCLTTTGRKEGSATEPQRNDSIYEILKLPIQALQSVDKYYSPYEKLQRILKLFKSVNIALLNALNNNNSIGAPKKLPSADDILPTMILTILLAKPKNILFNLRYIDILCEAESLRGEAGYAYTNLYGAAQFIQDIDLSNPTNSLSITLEEFRKYTSESSEQQQKKSTESINQLGSSLPMNISVREVRDARLQGENVDYQWALQWQKANKLSEQSPSGESTQQEHDGNAAQSIKCQNNIANLTDILPEGFSRQYNFLSAQPEEIRMVDLPVLLNEYKMLVRGIESLLSERASIIAEETKKKFDQEEQQLLDTVREYNMKEFTGASKDSTREGMESASPSQKQMRPKNIPNAHVDAIATPTKNKA